MSGKIKLLVFVVLAFGAFLLVALFTQHTAKVGAAPSDILLRAEIFDTDPNKLTSDGAGSYIHGVSPAGSVVVRILGPNRTQEGRFLMSVDNAGDPRGRSANLLLNDMRWPCEHCPPKVTTTIGADFSFISPFKTRYLEFESWGSTEPNSGMLFNFLTMEIGRPYYVAMAIYFRVTQDDGLASNLYELGRSGSVAEVTAYGAPGAPTSWIMKSVDPSDERFSDCPMGTLSHYRDLIREYQKFKGNRYSRQCYGWFYIPFEMHLTRL